MFNEKLVALVFALFPILLQTGCTKYDFGNGQLKCSVPDKKCPSDFHCSCDGYCWKQGDDAVCALPPAPNKGGVVVSGGTTAASPQYKVIMSTGQPPGGNSNAKSQNYKLNAGLPALTPSKCVTAFPATLWTGPARHLGLTVGSDPEMTPRELVTSVPYALIANDAIGDIHSNSITVNGTAIVNSGGQIQIPASSIDVSRLGQPVGGKETAQAQGTFFFPSGNGALQSITVTVPGPGLVHVIASGYSELVTHNNGTVDNWTLCLGSGGTCAVTSNQRMPAAIPSGSNFAVYIPSALP
jgi:hypothetical protein